MVPLRGKTPLFEQKKRFQSLGGALGPRVDDRKHETFMQSETEETEAIVPHEGEVGVPPTRSISLVFSISGHQSVALTSG